MNTQINFVKEYGSEFDWESNNNFLVDGFKNNDFMDSELFRSGRDALKAIAKKYRNKYNRILFPALCCESMVTPFELYGYEVLFYKLHPNLTADLEDILLKLNSNTLFLYMNYFGNILLSDRELNLVKDKYENILMIEDRTHDFFDSRVNNFSPHFSVCSIRKWIAIPDGGILYTFNNSEKFEGIEDAYFSNTRLIALKNKSNYLKNGDKNLKKIFREQFNNANKYIENSREVVKISSESYNLLKKIDFSKMKYKRKKNTMIMFNLLKRVSNMKILLKEGECCSLYFPILVEKRDTIQKLLSSKDIYCPVIWPLPKQANGVCKVSNYISENMLALPCDHRYDKDDIEYICNVVKQILENEL